MTTAAKCAATLLLLSLAATPAAAQDAPLCRFVIPAGTGQIDFAPAQIFEKCKPGDQLVLLSARSDYPELRAFDTAAQACDATKPIIFANTRTSFICTYRGRPQTR